MSFLACRILQILVFKMLQCTRAFVKLGRGQHLWNSLNPPTGLLRIPAKQIGQKCLWSISNLALLDKSFWAAGSVLVPSSIECVPVPSTSNEMNQGNSPIMCVLLLGLCGRYNHWSHSSILHLSLIGHQAWWLGDPRHLSFRLKVDGPSIFKHRGAFIDRSSQRLLNFRWS